MQELVDVGDGLEEVVNGRSFAGDFMGGEIAGDGVDKLGGAADALGGE